MQERQMKDQAMQRTDDLEGKVMELKKSLELRTLCLARPLLNRKGPEVLQAIQNFRIQLKFEAQEAPFGSHPLRAGPRVPNPRIHNMGQC